MKTGKLTSAVLLRVLRSLQHKNKSYKGGTTQK